MNHTSDGAEEKCALREVSANNFDAVRFVAAVTVVYSHCFPLLLWQGDGLDPLAKITNNEFTLGTVAVDVFFAVSGFLIVMSWERSSSAVSYLLKRMARIVPGYVCAVLIGLFVITPIFAASGQAWFSFPIARRCAKAMLQLKPVEVGGVFPLNPYPGIVNGSMWTISYEFKCYLGVLILGLIGGFRRRWCAWVLFLGSLGLCALHLFAKPHEFIEQNWPAIRLASFFAAGAIFYLNRDRIPRRPWFAVLSLVAVAGSLRVLPATLHLVLPTFGAYLLFWSVFQPYVTAHNFAKYGDFSYGIYLYAFPIQQALIATYSGVFSPMGVFLVAAPLSILAGMVSWHVVERHFLRKRGGRRLVAPPAAFPAVPTDNCQSTTNAGGELPNAPPQRTRDPAE